MKSLALVLRKLFLLVVLSVVLSNSSVEGKNLNECFPDGRPMSQWFLDKTKIPLEKLGRQFVITSFGAVNDSTILQTESIQRAINEAAAQGGGVVVIL